MPLGDGRRDVRRVVDGAGSVDAMVEGQLHELNQHGSVEKEQDPCGATDWPPRCLVFLSGRYIHKEGVAGYNIIRPGRRLTFSQRCNNTYLALEVHGDREPARSGGRLGGPRRASSSS